MYKLSIASLSVFAILTACAVPSQHVQYLNSEQLIRYVTQDGKNEITFNKEGMILKPVKERNYPSVYGVDYPMIDCSNNDIECLNFDRFTFAAFKSKVHEGMSYLVNGTKITVVRCYDEYCRRQNIISSCDRWWVEDAYRVCTPFSADDSSKESDITLSYEYEVDKGISVINIKYAGVGSTGADHFFLASSKALLGH